MVRQMVYSNINEAFFYADILTQIYRKDLRKKKPFSFKKIYLPPHAMSSSTKIYVCVYVYVHKIALNKI